MSNDDAEPAKPVGQWAQKSNPTVLSLEGTECVDEVKRGALVASNPLSARYCHGTRVRRVRFGDDVDPSSSMSELREQGDAVTTGHLSRVESMVLTQANTLDVIFNQLARKSAFEYLNPTSRRISRSR
ncbi:hypothetical protein J8I87_17455 [Paraburkholderia sp. LEh10]|uniref:hypothetical protein n=1 Tax=Paraburkholderia sp. LEh10 TaxID=2821353 RepID=UPI001AE80822|nr:hypothetical protein [Paraburkholderia sp. LEh10]MBP0591477.1 hypothetical protein [Paraburkholderia sp. LEh10]